MITYEKASKCFILHIAFTSLKFVVIVFASLSYDLAFA